MPRHSPYALIRLNFLLNFLQLFSLNCLSFIEHCLVCWFLSAFAVKRFDPFYVFSVRLRSFNLTFGNCSSLPKFFGKTYSNLLLKCVLFYLFVSTHFTSLFGFQWTFSLIGLLLTLLVKLYQLLAAGTACWWAQVDSNHRPRAYQARALTTWAMSPFSFSVHLVSLAYFFLPHLTSFADQVLAVRPSGLVEMMGFEPMTPCLQGRCSPSWATPPY